MSSYEQHVLVGNLGNDPETTELDSGSKVCKFRIATNRKYKDTEYTTWWTIEVWGSLGEVCQEWLSKGRQVLVIADRLTAYPYEDADGQLKASLQATAKDVIFLGGKRREEDSAPW